MQATNSTPRAPRPGTDPAPDDLALIDWRWVRDWALFVLRAPRRHRALALASLVAILGGAVAAMAVLPKKYEVQASILAQPNPLALEFNQNDAPTRAARDVVLRRDNVVSLLKQTDFIARHQKVRAPAARFKQWLFSAMGRKPATPDQLIEDTAEGVEARLQVSVVPNSGKVDFSFEWSNPELAYDVVEAAVQSFLEVRYASEVTTVGEIIALLQERAQKLAREIADKTKEVDTLEQQARASARPAAPRRRRVVRDDALDDLRARLAAKRQSLSQMEDFRSRRITDLQQTLVQQMTIYTERHPVIETTKRSLDALNVASPQLEGMRSEVAQLEAELGKRGATPGEALHPSAHVEVMPSALAGDDPHLEYERYKLGLMVRQQSSVLERIEATRLQMETNRSGFKYRYLVVKPPQMPKGPLKPKAALVAAAALVGGIFFAFFACVVYDLWSGRIVEQSQVERQLGLRVLAVGDGARRLRA